MAIETTDYELIQRSRTLREVFDRGQQAGIEKGRGQGVEQILRRLFARRLGRGLTSLEQQELADRSRTLGPERVEDVALDLPAEELVAWLADPDAR